MKLFFIILCLMQLESSNNPDAIGDMGNAIGILQISPILVEDINRIVGQTRYSVYDCRNVDKSVEMASIYFSHYGSEQRLGRRPYARDLLLMWNGGPNFYRYPNTPDAKYYLEKAERFLDKYNLSTLSVISDMNLSTEEKLYFHTQFSY